MLKSSCQSKLFRPSLAVVLATYLSAPYRKFQAACVALLAGSITAWIVLEPSWYPDSEQYHPLAYQPTHLPLIATLAGGLVGLVLVAVLWYRTRA